MLLNRVVMERTETPARLAALVGEQLANVGDTNVIAIAQELLADVDAIEGMHVFCHRTDQHPP